MSQCHISLDLYTKHLVDGFAELQHSEEFVDMTIAADDHLVKVHKNLIALASPFIRDMIRSAPCPHPVIFLSNIRKQILTYILEYIYTGEVNVRVEHMNELIKAAKSLHLKGLESMIPPPPHSMNWQSRTVSGQKDKSDVVEVVDEEIDNTNEIENNNVIENNYTENTNTENYFVDLRDTVSETNENPEPVPRRVIDLTGQIINKDSQASDYYTVLHDSNLLDIGTDTQERESEALEEKEDYSISNYGNEDEDVEMQSQDPKDPNIKSVEEPSLIPTFTVNIGSENVYSTNIQIDNTKQISQTNTRGPLIYYTGSSRGSIQLIANRFMYYLHFTANGGRKCRWRCIDYRQKGCKAFIDTVDEKLTVRKYNHMHRLHDEKIHQSGSKYGTFTSIKETRANIAAQKEKKETEVNDLDTD